MLLRRVYILCAGIATCLAGPPDRKKCRVLPGDRDWPNEGAWQKLNKTVSGRLIAAKSPGYVCHDPTYDEEACKALQTTWTLPQMQ